MAIIVNGMDEAGHKRYVLWVWELMAKKNATRNVCMFMYN